MALRFTPLDIRNQEFAKKLQGYKPEEVRVFLSQVAEFVDNLLQENRSLQNEIDALHKRISSLEKQATTIKEAMEEQAKRTIAEAEEQAEQMINQAETRAQSVLREMQLEVETKREELYELAGIYESYKGEMLRTLDGLLKSVNEFEEKKESRKANKAIAKLGVKMRPVEPLDPLFVIKHTVHRRKKRFFTPKDVEE
ncbi:hypothetical protein DRQ33_08465 [bacterium]|nr:MAG: hypothetical protein DRQ33_08465 [bacterium]